MATKVKALNPSAASTTLSPSQIERVLVSGCLEGFTPGVARKLVGQFGRQVLEAIEGSDIQAKTLLGSNWNMASDEILEHADAVPLLGWLLEQGFSGTMARRAMIWQKHESDWKNPFDALSAWKTDPYLLSDIPGITFERADRIALGLGTNASGDARVLACAREALRISCDNAGGGARLSDAQSQARRMLSMNAALTPKEVGALSTTCFDLAQKEGLAKVAVDETGSQLLFSSDLYEAEERAAHLMLAMLDAESPLKRDDLEKQVEALEKTSGLTLNDEQRDALATMFKGRISIVCGKPGSGKTTLLKCAAPLLEAGGKKILYAAPTGKAAKRMSQSLGRHASTLHRLLAVGMEGKGKSSKASQAGNGNMSGAAFDSIKTADAIVVDETSMLDSKMFLRLLRSVGPKTSLIFVGDPDQLPSVGAGKVLRDLIDSKRIPTAIMTKVMRQSANSSITAVARAIGSGEWIDFKDKQSDCVMLEEPDAFEIAPRIAKMLLGAAKGKYDPLRDVQVLAATNKGDAGVVALNAQLQRLLNPPAPGKAQAQIKDDVILRVGDKVMQTSNDYERVLTLLQGDPSQGNDLFGVGLVGLENATVPVAMGSKKGVFNGDVGYIESIKSHPAPGKVVVKFDDGVAEYDFKEAASSLSLSYACTVHKFQGSEAPLIFFVMHESTPGILRTRNLVYTAITRAKKKCLVMGSENVVRSTVKRDALATRRTRLKGLLDGSITVDNTASSAVLALSEKQGFQRMVEDNAADLKAEQLALIFDGPSTEEAPGAPSEADSKPKTRRRAKSL